tara:strand:- start:533 stop:1324 length:792 start_codon:yes stop_codon:yes gene_type:complete
LQTDQDYSIYKLIFLFLVSFFSNIFSAISGGGAGLIQLPALLLFGIPYYQALALHKVATVALGFGGSLRNFRYLNSDLLIIFALLIIGIPGVLVGSLLVTIISNEYLYLIIGVLSIFLGSYSFTKPDLGLATISKDIDCVTWLRFICFIFLISILNGSISSGTGLLVTILLIKTFGMDFLKAISITFFSVGIFWNASGAIALSQIGVLPLNLLMLLLLGSFLGGLFGSHLSNLKGNKLIKRFFTFLCFLVGLSLCLKFLNQII